MVYWAGGWTVGQRHLTPVVPFLVAPAAALVDRSAIARVLAPGLAAASVMMTGIATVVFPHLPEWFKNPFHDLVLPLLREGCVASVWTEPAVGAAVVAAVTVGAFLLLAIAAVSAWRGGLAVKAAAVVLLALLPLGWYDWTSRVQRDEPAEIADDVGWFRGQCRSAGRIEVAPDAPRGPVPDAPPALPETPPGARPRPGATPFPGAAPLPGVTQRPGGPPPRPLP
jgi:hypothetical protein